MLRTMTQHYKAVLQRILHLDGLAPLLLRLYLAPVMMQAGWTKFQSFDSTVAWFGNADWGLGLPFPELMVVLAAGTELVGGALLIPGIAVRLVSIPLMATMVVAALTVHLEHGWLERAKNILQEHGNYSWLTGRGSLVVLNNGIEFAATYFIMLLTLLFTGGGRYTSVDFYVSRSLERD